MVFCNSSTNYFISNVIPTHNIQYLSQVLNLKYIPSTLIVYFRQYSRLFPTCRCWGAISCWYVLFPPHAVVPTFWHHSPQHCTHFAPLLQEWHNSKCIIFQEGLLKVKFPRNYWRKRNTFDHINFQTVHGELQISLYLHNNFWAFGWFK